MGGPGDKTRPKEGATSGGLGLRRGALTRGYLRLQRKMQLSAASRSGRRPNQNREGNECARKEREEKHARKERTRRRTVMRVRNGRGVSLWGEEGRAPERGSSGLDPTRLARRAT
jgi:hypothetical protein